MSSERSWAIASGGVKPRPPATTRSGSSADDLLDVDGRERGHVGQVDRGLRVVAAIVGRDDAVAGADLEQDLGRGRGQRHDDLRLGRELDGRALVVGERDRERGRRCGLGAAGAEGLAEPEPGLAPGLAGAGDDAPGAGTPPARRRARATGRRRGVGDRETWAGILRDRFGPEGWCARHARPLASRRIEGGVRGWCARSCLPFSRRFEHAP